MKIAMAGFVPAIAAALPFARCRAACAVLSRLGATANTEMLDISKEGNVRIQTPFIAVLGAFSIQPDRRAQVATVAGGIDPCGWW